MTPEDVIRLMGRDVAFTPHGASALFMGKVRAYSHGPCFLLEHPDGTTQRVPVGLVKDWLAAQQS